MKLASQLKKILKKKDLTVQQLCRAVKGVSDKKIYSWLNSQTPRNLDDVKAVADYLGVSLDYLLYDETKFEKKISIEELKEEISLGVLELIVRTPKK